MNIISDQSLIIDSKNVLLFFLDQVNQISVTPKYGNSIFSQNYKIDASLDIFYDSYPIEFHFLEPILNTMTVILNQYACVTCYLFLYYRICCPSLGYSCPVLLASPVQKIEKNTPGSYVSYTF